MSAVTIRPYRPGDAGATARLFYDSVRHGADPRYDARQRAAWAPAVPAAEAWDRRLSGMNTLVAVEGEGTEEALVGFMSLDANGCLDLAFVQPAQHGRGIARRLYDALEAQAHADGLTRLTAHASFGLRPFLETRGWTVLHRRRPVRNGVALTNFAMEKRLTP